MPVFTLKPPTTLTTIGQPNDSDSDNWLDTFEEHDLDDLLASVRDDALKRQALKKATAADQLAPIGQHSAFPSPLPTTAALDFEERFSPTIDVFHSTRRGKDTKGQAKLQKYMLYMVKTTVAQEIDQCMLKLCRIAVEGTRKANVVRAIAAETFCVLDSWLRNVHVAEQNYVDDFLDTATAAMQPDDGVLPHDPKRWTLIVPPVPPIFTQSRV